MELASETGKAAACTGETLIMIVNTEIGILNASLEKGEGTSAANHICHSFAVVVVKVIAS